MTLKVSVRTPEITQIVGPRSWSIYLIRLWADIERTHFVRQLEAAKLSSNEASLLQLGPREWWMMSEKMGSVELVSRAAGKYACVVDISAAYLALTLKGEDAIRLLSRIGNAHDEDWLRRANGRRLALADCSVVVVHGQHGELILLVARSEFGHLLLALRRSLEADAAAL